MTNSEFEYFRRLVYERSRINLGPDKHELLAARLGKRLRATQVSSIGEYRELLETRRREEEITHLIDAISTNHTFFFRENAHFEFVRRHVVPEMMERARLEGWTRFDAWSAACSSGEEPYSLAITLAESRLAGVLPWHIEATDISNRVLARAKAAIFSEASVGKMPVEHLRAHFQKGVGPQAGNYRVKPDLTSNVSFRQLNLLEGDLPFQGLFQVIFCRNVMIYFDRPTQEELIARLTRCLVPGGYLLVGHSESLSGIRHLLQSVRPATYRRPPAS
jgi:chemotaxis protein methyltransferase CheR